MWKVPCLNLVYSWGGAKYYFLRPGPTPNNLYTSFGGGAQMQTMTPQMMQYASQFQMPQMDQETAATYAQYYQQYYMQMAEAGAQMARESVEHNSASGSKTSAYQEHDNEQDNNESIIL